jgi:hypothetical protein
MRHSTFRALILPSLVVLSTLVVTSSAKALRVMAPPPIPERVAQAETIIVGKVTRIEKAPVAVLPFPGAEEKTEYVVAVVEITEALQGAKGLTSIKVGFVAPPPQAPPGGGGIRPNIRPGRMLLPSLTKDQEVCLFLRTHYTGEFHVLNAYFDLIDKSSDTFGKDVELIKKCVKLMTDPDQGLRAKDSADRLLVAGMLISRYCTPLGFVQGDLKQEPIDAEQSKRILHILADADWTKLEAGLERMNPANLFARLGVTAEDGWNPPQDFNQLPAAAKNWLQANAETYRIKRWVEEKKDADKK